MNEESYSLEVKITPDQLATIYTAEACIAVGKHAVNEKLNVAWQVFKPMQRNYLMWVDHYGIYASTCGIKHGSEIMQHSKTPLHASKNKIYTVQADGGISSPRAGGSADSFIVHNRYSVKKVMTIGLYQSANVNGDDIFGNAISAAPVMLGHTANITPDSTVYIWLQANVKSNTIITSVSSDVTKLHFTPECRQITVTYNDENGLFVTE